MTALLSIENLRGGAAVLWGVACVLLVLPALRALFGRDRKGDPWKAVVFFCGALFCAFPSRSIIRPTDDSARQGLFLLSILLAVYVVVLEVQDWREGRG